MDDVQNETPQVKPRIRIGVKARVLAAMVLAMTIFFLALLATIYSHVARAESVGVARSVVSSLIPIVACILAVCGLLFFFLTNSFVLRPIRRIRDEALAISNGKLDVVIKAAHNDEIGDLAHSVDRMATVLKRDIQSLEEVDKLKSEFISLGSHTLRTPLASIEGGLDILQSAPLDTQARDMLEVIRSSANNLIAFSEDMLTIANVEATHGGVTQQSVVALSELFEPVITDIATMATKKGVHFETQLVAEDARIRANVQLLRLAFRNILENACKFTKSGGSVLLSADETDDRVVVQIVDTGIGIPAKELPNLFTKFHRGTDVLTYDYEGLGIGLYVAKLIFDQHDASITITSEQGKGTTVTVSVRPVR